MPKINGKPHKIQTPDLFWLRQWWASNLGNNLHAIMLPFHHIPGREYQSGPGRRFYSLSATLMVSIAYLSCSNRNAVHSIAKPYQLSFKSKDTLTPL